MCLATSPLPPNPTTKVTPHLLPTNPQAVCCWIIKLNHLTEASYKWQGLQSWERERDQRHPFQQQAMESVQPCHKSRIPRSVSTVTKHCDILRYFGNVILYFLKIYKAQKQGKMTEELRYNPLPPQKAPHKYTNRLYTVGVNTALPQYAHNSFS